MHKLLHQDSSIANKMNKRKAKRTGNPNDSSRTPKPTLISARNQTSTKRTVDRIANNPNMFLRIVTKRNGLTLSGSKEERKTLRSLKSQTIMKTQLTIGPRTLHN